ncbi:MAG: hypothetical protein GF399_08870 [Candidatus Coatesbacteria bacterium]|nr:hypothetical protein [Candidatus Coatesbacteria bacterium]
MVMRKATILLVCLLLTAFIAGCKHDDDGDDEVIEDTVIEGEIITDADTVEEGDLVTFTVPDETDPETHQLTETADGFRVQLVASTNESAARELAAEAERVLGEPAYVEYLDGYWKVRVGNCSNRSAAETLRNKARSSGYADAWIAATQIEQ